MISRRVRRSILRARGKSRDFILPHRGHLVGNSIIPALQGVLLLDIKAPDTTNGGIRTIPGSPISYSNCCVNCEDRVERELTPGWKLTPVEDEGRQKPRSLRLRGQLSMRPYHSRVFFLPMPLRSSFDYKAMMKLPSTESNWNQLETVARVPSMGSTTPPPHPNQPLVIGPAAVVLGASTEARQIYTLSFRQFSGGRGDILGHTYASLSRVPHSTGRRALLRIISNHTHHHVSIQERSHHRCKIQNTLPRADVHKNNA